LVKKLKTGGRVRAARETELIARVGGMIDAALVFNGKSVREGDTLVRLDDREYRAAFERASANLLSAQIEYRSLLDSPYRGSVDPAEAERQAALARRELERIEEVHRAGASPGPERVRARREYETRVAYLNAKREDVIASKSGLLQAMEAFERARRDLDATAVRAPFAGLLANVAVNKGEYLQPGKAICSIIDVSRLFINVDLLEHEVGAVTLGQLAEMLLPGIPGVPFRGVVRTINPLVDARSRTVSASIELVEDARRRPRPQPGMYASVGIHVETAISRLVVPREAVLVRDEKELVFVLENGRAHWRYVGTGVANEVSVEILTGILEADTVLTHGHELLADEARVRIVPGER
jgi:RND family efflux transporter MFP subunit